MILTRKKSNDMKRHMLMLPVFLVAMVALVLGATAPETWARGWRHHRVLERVPFAETAIFFEYNSTDQDLGLHIFFDAEGWKEVEVRNANGEIFEVENGGGLRDIGSTEVFTESAEPPLCPQDEDENGEECTPEEIEAAIQEFQDKFPEGIYRFRGTTVDGKRLRGEAELSWDLPLPPEIISPAEPDDPEEGNPADIRVIAWEEGEENIVGWEVVAELVFEMDDEEKVYVNTAILPAEVTQLNVPRQFVRLTGLEGLVEAKIEVIAIAENGNKTITEVAVFEAVQEEE